MTLPSLNFVVSKCIHGCNVLCPLKAKPTTKKSYVAVVVNIGKESLIW